LLHKSFSAKFGETWAKYPSHPQKFACSYAYVYRNNTDILATGRSIFVSEYREVFLCKTTQDGRKFSCDAENSKTVFRKVISTAFSPKS